VQSTAEVHDTPFRKLAVALAGRTACWIDHLDPFQPIATLIAVRPRVRRYPDAVHAVAEVHETLDR